MEHIIGGRGTGKTHELMIKAKENNATIACKNPHSMRYKAEMYGITGIDFISYSELFTGKYQDNNIMIDELANFVADYIGGNLKGYTLTND